MPVTKTKTYTFKSRHGDFEHTWRLHGFEKTARMCTKEVRFAFDLKGVRTIDLTFTNKKPKNGLHCWHILKKAIAQKWRLTTGQRSYEPMVMGSMNSLLDHHFPTSTTLYVCVHA